MEKITKQNSNKNLNGTYKKNNNSKAKIIVGTIIGLLIIALIGCAIYLSIVVNENYQLKQNLKQNFTKEAEIILTENGSSSMAFSMVNNVISGVQYPQNVAINCNNISKIQVVRVKANLISSDAKSFETKLIVNSNWIVGADGYYYYFKKVISPNNFEVCSAVELPNEFSINNINENKHVLIVTAESLDFNLDVISSVWNNAPASWLIAIS